VCEREHLSGKHKLNTPHPMGSIEEGAITQLGFITATSDGLKVGKGRGEFI